jgi:peptide/nickel transport system permease protein
MVSGVEMNRFFSRTIAGLKKALDSDIFYSFTRSPTVVVAAIVTIIYITASMTAPWIAPHQVFDVKTIDLMDAFTPPAWLPDGLAKFPLGTDDQGRDVLSTILFGSRVSLLVAFASIFLAMIIGVGLGLISGYAGGRTDAFIMRIADIQLTFPAILIALLINGLARGFLPQGLHDEVAIYVLIIAIALARWVQFARTVRSSTMVEKNKEYVKAARVIGRHPAAIMFQHVLPNVTGPVLVIATISLALAVIIEASLSFLGVGVPSTQPSLGTLIRIGNNYLLSGEWWMTIFPSGALIVLVLSINLLGDWLRDALNPKLR